MAKRPFVGITRGLILDGKHWRQMGSSPLFLFALLVEKQNTPTGFLNSGKPISYGWIRAQMKNPPGKRTLERYMSRLKRWRYVETRRVMAKRDVCAGFIVQVCNQKKWALQLSLPLSHTVSTVPVRQNCRTVPHKSVGKKNLEESTGSERVKTRTRNPRAPSSPPDHRARIAARDRRLVRELDVAKEIASGGPTEFPRSFRDIHPDLLREIAELSRRRAM